MNIIGVKARDNAFTVVSGGVAIYLTTIRIGLKEVSLFIFLVRRVRSVQMGGTLGAPGIADYSSHLKASAPLKVRK